MENKIYNFLKPMVDRTKEFLEEDMELEVIEFSTPTSCIETNKLQKNIAMIGITGSANFMMALSYDDKLIEKLVDVFLEGETVADDEKDEAFESIANEVANTVIGNALPEDENELFITPPIFIKEAESLSKNKDSKIIISTMTTEYGDLSIMAIFNI